jgi:hypothetical protein
VVPPWAILGVIVVLLLGALFVLGSFGGDDEPTPAAKPTRTATPKKQRKPKARKKTPAAPKLVKLQLLPEATVNVCLENASGEPLIRSQNLTEPTETYRSKRMRVTFGNGQVSMKIGAKTYPVPDTDHAVGYELRPGAPPQDLPEDELPTCV